MGTDCWDTMVAFYDWWRATHPTQRFRHFAEAYWLEYESRALMAVFRGLHG